MVVINLTGATEAAFEDNVWGIFHRVYLTGALTDVEKVSVSRYANSSARDFLIEKGLIETLEPEPITTEKGKAEVEVEG